MRTALITLVATAVLGSGAASASPIGATTPLQFAQAGQERRELREERREDRRERREERQELREALQPEVRTRVHRYVTTTRSNVVEIPTGFTVTTGAILPGNIVLQAFPADVGVTEYQYVIIGQQPVLVEPRTRRIVEIIR